MTSEGKVEGEDHLSRALPYHIVPWSLLLKHADPSSEDISDLASGKVSFGVAWVLLQLLRKGAGRLSFQRLKLCSGPSTVKGDAFPLFCRFLQRLGKAEGERGQVPLVKSLRFEGCILEREALTAVEESISSGRLSSLRCLRLDELGLKAEDMERVLEGFAASAGIGKALKVETLSLQRVRFGVGGVGKLCGLLQSEVLPCVRELSLVACALGEESMIELSKAIREGNLRRVESLDLSQNMFREKGMIPLAEVLKASFLPCLKTLVLRGYGGNKEGAGILVRALSSDDRPPLENLDVGLERLGEAEARVVGLGGVPSLRGVGMVLSGASAFALLSAIEEAPEAPRWNFLAVTMMRHWLSQNGEGDSEASGEALRALDAALRSGRLGRLKMLMIRSRMGRSEGEKVSFCGAFASVHFPVLIHLNIPGQKLEDEDLVQIGEGVRRGHFPVLQRLRLGQNLYGQKGVEGLMAGVCDAERGLRHLDSLDFFGTEGWRGMDVLGQALKLGKLPKLSRLILRSCHVSDKGIQALVEVLRANDLVFLKDLDLADNDITEEGIRTFLRALTPASLPRLASLYLEFNAGTRGVQERKDFAEMIEKLKKEGKLRSLSKVRMQWA
uniref:Uncharacterized protein n=1 Tax=Chromera velia CCMP2878 TaxID=1169474 RepID=A0A0G4GLX9_9ALVE|eukprot:Cvel_22479.t1-p1 / transcript=Cvel_22479.t1 / gene=Cvel_22479 / organism=Chromera_velia_CCMP2878 / gene_product=hypothetical protein / transcript_product=hypothetical protein / location=Cvel_scaffold2213:8527-13340(-) / protein_length=613 / sequence_SO=supercontig / SO=protein_coding / is_pseudo=false